jgi:hypothetical protein
MKVLLRVASGSLLPASFFDHFKFNAMAAVLLTLDFH